MQPCHHRERMGAVALSLIVIALSTTAVPDYVSKALAIERLLPWARRHPEVMRFIDGRFQMDWFEEALRSHSAPRLPASSDPPPPASPMLRQDECVAV